MNTYMLDTWTLGHAPCRLIGRWLTWRQELAYLYGILFYHLSRRSNPPSLARVIWRLASRRACSQWPGKRRWCLGSSCLLSRQRCRPANTGFIHTQPLPLEELALDFKVLDRLGMGSFQPPPLLLHLQPLLMHAFA